MIRNLKVLGLAMAAVFAFSAISASAASAQQGMLTAPEAVTLVGTEQGGVGANALTAFGGKTECPGSTYTGHKLKTTPHEPIPSGASSFTVTPHYNQPECLSESGGSIFSETVNMNGCDYEFVLGATTGGENTYGLDVYVVCPVGSKIQRDAFSGQAHGFRLCRTEVGPQGPLKGLHATDNTNGTVTVSGLLEGTHMEKSGLCGAGTTAEGEIDFNVAVVGEGEEGVVPLGISH